MESLPPDHSRRQEFNDEVHARPTETLSAPLRLSYLALFAEGALRQQGWDCVAALTARFGVEPPPADAHHFSADLGPFRVKCERHTEFLRFAFIVAGGTDDPFAEPAIGLVPPDWLATLPARLSSPRMSACCAPATKRRHSNQSPNAFSPATISSARPSAPAQRSR